MVYENRMYCGSISGEADYSYALAQWAKVELLKEKVKQRMASHYGKKLDKVADLIAEVVLERAKNSGQVAEKQSELETAIQNLRGGAQ